MRTLKKWRQERTQFAIKTSNNTQPLDNWVQEMGKQHYRKTAYPSSQRRHEGDPPCAVSADETRRKTHRKTRSKAHSALCYFCCVFSCDFCGGANSVFDESFRRFAASPEARSNTRSLTRFGSRPHPPNHGENHLGGRGRDPVLVADQTWTGGGQQGGQCWVTKRLNRQKNGSRGEP